MVNYRQWCCLACLGLALAACGKKPAAPPAQAVSAGEQIWNKNCKVCHSQGINGAPIIGNSTMWQPRLSQGKDVLYEHALNGFGLMPAKGGATHLADADVQLAVDYMVSKVQ